MKNELADELRRFNGLGAAMFRAAAASLRMPATDLQAVDLLGSSGPATPGQLADLTGLTTGAVTGMLKHLEDAGLVRRDAGPATPGGSSSASRATAAACERSTGCSAP